MYDIKNRITKKIIGLLESQQEAKEAANSSGTEVEEEERNEFFGCLFDDKNSRKGSASKFLEEFLKDAHTKNVLDTFSKHKELKQLFVQFNTPLPSSAAVERLFSVRKNVLLPKQASLSDNHFQMMVFL